MSAKVNEGKVILSSAARTATATSDEQDNRYARGVMLVVDVTTVAGGALALRPDIQVKAMGTDSWKAINSAATIDATGAVAQYVYVLYPGVTDSDTTLKDIQAIPLPRVWRLSMNHSTSQSITYSVTAYSIV